MTFRGLATGIMPVLTRYIAQVKRKYGILSRKRYNTAKSESAKMLICPPDKEKAIEEALRFFGMIA